VLLRLMMVGLGMQEVAQILAEVGEMNTPEKMGKYLT
jgi:hypothetical protein